MRRDCKTETIETNIRKHECRVTKQVKYEAKKYGRCKMLDTIEQARKYIDKVCIEMGKKQVYNTFKAV